ncbi:MAG: hypothetical protein JKY46_04470 [Robiginitomaculum sp.]|nr:hypothetical protein [Robiginitomaculum sp.]
MIYIDPPYNTGGDGFVYEDDRKFTAEELSSLAGVGEDEAKRILEFTQSKSNSHSAWLTFMFPRLYIARELLRDDGVIFISIDDNEQAQLKMLCDEVFGEENFVAELIWERAYAPKNDAKYISNSHDYVVMYTKNINSFRIGRLLRTEKANARYKNLDNDPRGVWKPSDMSVKTYNSKCDYPITTPSGRIIEPPAGRCWSLSKKAFSERLQDNRIYFGLDGANVPCIKRFLSELKFDGMAPQSIMFYKDVGHSQEGAKEVTTLLNDGAFDGPKPIRLLTRLITLAKTESNNIILDFFAGSGTTAHAVMALNAEDGGNRKHITVQLDEKTAAKSEARKAGYETIFEITRERIKRAAKKIQSESPDAKCDFGFKEFRTIPAFENYLDMAETSEEFDLFDAEKLSDEQRAQLMLTWQVYDGLPLHLDLSPIEFAPTGLEKYTAYQGEHIIYFLNPNLELDHIIELLGRIDNDPGFTPRKLVVFAYILSSKAQREITEAVKNYNNRKQIELHLELRF